MGNPMSTLPSDALSPPPRPALTANLLPRQLSDAERELFASVGQRREVGAGTAIFRRGELGRAMFLIDGGQVKLEFGDGIPDRLIGPREFFGELALFIGNHARVASAYAATDATLYVIEHAVFERLLDHAPGLLARFMRRSFSYLVASEQQLIASLKRRNEDLQLTLDSLRRTRSQLVVAERLVQTDELTGLCNRRGLYNFLEQLAPQDSDRERLGVLLIDIDQFKLINDHRGHLMGDRVLQAISHEIQNSAAACDLPCRIGGDEFALIALVPNVAELEARARQIFDGVQRLRFAAPFDDLRITVSIGGRMCNLRAGWSTWYSEADSVLYQVKGVGGDGVRVYD